MPAQLLADPRELAGALTDQIPVGQGLQQFGIAQAVLDKQSDAPLIKKDYPIKESMAAFYTRAERMGVGRQCLACGGKRRYSLVQCPFCFGYLASEIRLKPQTPDPETLPVEPRAKGLDEPSATEWYSYQPITDPDKVKELPNKGYLSSSAVAVSAASLGSVPLDQRSLAELQEFAHIQGIELPKSKSRDKILGIIQKRFGAVEPTASKLPDLAPLPPDLAPLPPDPSDPSDSADDADEATTE